MSTKTRTITMSGRAPIKIKEDEWPVIAEAKGDSFSGSDYSRHQQALNQCEVGVFWLKVRQHADGRSIVYGSMDGATVWTGTPSYRGGYLLAKGWDIVSAIRIVAQGMGLSVVAGDSGAEDGDCSLVADCIADLPAEEV